MVMKKLINSTDTYVSDQLMGVAKAHPELKVNFNPKYVVRRDAPVKGKVAVVSGGGSGHEPLHVGFVGPGMLDGACPGEVFTPPTADQMVACARAVNGGAGVLFLVKNFAGDILNFETALELLHAEGHQAQIITIDDDVGDKDSRYALGRRGIGTTIVAEKIVGAAAEAGYSLLECADLARDVNQAGRSIGIALKPCVLPTTHQPTFPLHEHEVEFGVGIHGERGRAHIPYAPANELVEKMMTEILADKLYTRSVREWDMATGEWIESILTDLPLKAGEPVILLVNGLGGTPLSELYIVFNAVAEYCERRSIQIMRSLIGPYITSLDMHGCSVTIVRSTQKLLDFWDAPVQTMAIRWGA